MIWIVFSTILVLVAVFVPRYIHDLVNRQSDEITSLRPARNAARIGSSILALICFFATSYVMIDADNIGQMKRKYGGGSMPPGQIIAVNGENGLQADVLAPGFHFSPFLNVLYTIDEEPFTEIPEGHYGLLIARDGKPFREGQFLADRWPEDKFAAMLNAKYFLTIGGQKGPQLTVLRPGKYPLNRYLFDVVPGKAVSVEAGEVAVIKSNVQEVEECAPIPHRHAEALSVPLVPKGCVGVWVDPLLPSTYYLNERAYTPIKISTRVNAWEYKGGYIRRYIDLIVDQSGKIAQKEREETVKEPDYAADGAINVQVEGWLVPLELRVLAQVAPEDAPFVVASVGHIQEIEDNIITPTMRSVLRNVTGAEKRKVFDLLDKRAELETLVEEALVPEGRKAGISIKEVRFGEPVIPPELLVARLRKQLANQLKETYEREQEAQKERINTENARSRADQQVELVKAEIAVKVAEQRRTAAQLEGEGEKLRLTEIAAGQKAQTEVLGAENVLRLAMLKEMLAAATANPELVKVPNVLVQGSGSGLEGSAAILGASNLVQGLLPSPQTKK